MACPNPIPGWFSKNVNPSGKRSVVFNLRDGILDLPVQVPCGKCIHCRLDKAQAWAVRMTHEASLHTENSFITLTYSDENLPKDLGLSVRDTQLFLKKLRKKISPKKIRYFLCGEYGSETFRPHYHAIIFGHDFKDKILFDNKNGHKIYVSEQLDKLWNKGFSTIGDVSFDSAGYVARYATKKILGPSAKDYYGDLQPEFSNMSKRPYGIGEEWFRKYYKDVYPDDFVVMNGRKIQPPRYYDKLLEIIDPELSRLVKAGRIRAQKEKQKNIDSQPSKLSRHKVKLAQSSHLKRGN
jgi:hypothetical protein